MSVLFGVHSFDGDSLSSEDLNKLLESCQRMYNFGPEWLSQGPLFASASLFALPSADDAFDDFDDDI